MVTNTQSRKSERVEGNKKIESKAAPKIAAILKNLLQGKPVKEESLNKVEVLNCTNEGVVISVVVLPSSVHKHIKRSISAAIESAESILGGTVFFVRRRVASGLKKGEKCYRTGPTYKDYQEAVAADLALPFCIVDRRTLVREDGSRLEKIVLDINSEKEMAHRFGPMGIVFEKLFEKKASFKANYY